MYKQIKKCSWLLMIFLQPCLTDEALRSIKLNEFPFLISHDAATGDLIRENIVSEWAKTQNGGLSTQIDCGSRAFDYRPYYENGILYAHHGDVVVRKPMRESLSEVVEWSYTNPEELIIFFVTDCGGDSGCLEAAIDLLNEFKIYTITNCSDFQGMTYGAALDQGGILATIDCVNEQYDPSIECYGMKYVCYDSWPNNSDIPWNAMKQYAVNSTSSIPTNDGTMWMTQLHWQYGAVSTTLGTLHNSSILLDGSRSNMNSWVAETITLPDYYKYLNLVEINDVCNGGLEIAAALRKRLDLSLKR